MLKITEDLPKCKVSKAQVRLSGTFLKKSDSEPILRGLRAAALGSCWVCLCSPAGTCCTVTCPGSCSAAPGSGAARACVLSGCMGAGTAGGCAPTFTCTGKKVIPPFSLAIPVT